MREPLRVFNHDLPWQTWLIVLFGVLAVALFYVAWMYVKDSRGVGVVWASLLGFLRLGVYGILALVFLLPANQSFVETRSESKVLLLFDVSGSMSTSDELAAGSTAEARNAHGPRRRSSSCRTARPTSCPGWRRRTPLPPTVSAPRWTRNTFTSPTAGCGRARRKRNLSATSPASFANLKSSPWPRITGAPGSTPRFPCPPWTAQTRKSKPGSTTCDATTRKWSRKAWPAAPTSATAPSPSSTRS